jgi:hypothetical protein
VGRRFPVNGPVHPAVALQFHVIAAARPGVYPRDQRRHFRCLAEDAPILAVVKRPVFGDDMVLPGLRGRGGGRSPGRFLKRPRFLGAWRLVVLYTFVHLAKFTVDTGATRIL